MGSKYQAEPLSRADIRGFAELLRGMMGLKDELYVDVLRILEIFLPSIGIQYEIIPVNEMSEEGKATPEENIIGIREDVYYGALKGTGRYRYTVMHEIGHAFLHGRERISFARGEGPVPAYKDPEWQADVFAGEFLVPKELVKNMTKKEIADSCGVSLRAAEVQLKHIKK